MKADVAEPPAALSSRNPAAWLTVFGPGAIIASLTIGTGELIFSSRGGAIFGYRVLFLFVLIAVLKWTLVFSTARHMVLSGVHPFQRWMQLPLGPPGWFPMVLFLFAVICIPIWVSFHAGVLGNLLSGVSGTRQFLGGGADQLWGAAVLCGVLLLSFTGGYQALERTQLVIVTALLAAVTVALIIFRPDWLELLAGAVVPQELEFPQWLLDDPRPRYREIASRPVWVEATLYVGVIGGASYDYLAYTSFLRDKKWGLAAFHESAAADLEAIASDCSHPVRRWVRAPLIDCTLSFIVVIAFSAVFVASGAIVLAPEHQIPGDGNFLEHQAQFVTRLHPWLYPLYVVGALLTMLGTLYGTLEVAPTVFREMYQAIGGDPASRVSRRIRLVSLGWCAAGALIVLSISFAFQMMRGEPRPAALTSLLIPANLFTGVLSCGFICLLNPWMDARFLPKPLRMPRALVVLNLAAGAIFVALGLKGYWDHSGWIAMGILAATVLGACLIAWAFSFWRCSD